MRLVCLFVFHRAWECWDSFYIDLSRILNWLCFSWNQVRLRLCSHHQGLRYALALPSCGVSFRKLHVDVELIGVFLKDVVVLWRRLKDSWAEFTEEIFVMWSERASPNSLYFDKSFCALGPECQSPSPESWKCSIWMRYLCAVGSPPSAGHFSGCEWIHEQRHVLTR